jgi:DNA-binding IclR family transcriptional regulator
VTTDPGADRRSIADRNGLSAAGHLLEVLKLFGERKQVLLADVRDRVGVPSTTAYRLLSTLEAAGFIERGPKRGYRAGAAALTWAASLLSSLDVRTVARPILERMPTLPGEAVYLAVLREAGLVAVDILHPDAMPHVLPEPLNDDMRVPLHASALGHAVAVHLSPHRLSDLLGPEPYRRWTAATPVTWSELAPRLEDVRGRGIAIARDGVTTGLTGVAAPLFAGRAIAGAISITGPSTLLDGHRVEKATELVRRAAVEISLLLSPRAPVGDEAWDPTPTGEVGAAS